MSNLQPTPIVDKNGKHTTVHKKASSDTSVSRSLPVPTVSVSPITRLYRGTAALIYDEDKVAPSETESLMHLLHMDDETTLPLIERCLTTGTPQAQEMSRGYFLSMLSDLGDAQKDTARKGDYEGYFKDYYGHLLNPEFSTGALRIWNAVNVADESGVSVSNEQLFEVISMLETSCPAMDPHFTQNSSDWYWRGVAAVAITHKDDYAKVMDNNSDDQVTEFIEWAGKHENVAHVIQTASERGTLDVATVQAIMEMQDLSSPVREGVL